jgi:hypothetical protein
MLLTNNCSVLDRSMQIEHLRPTQSGSLQLYTDIGADVGKETGSWPVASRSWSINCREFKLAQFLDPVLRAIRASSSDLGAVPKLYYSSFIYMYRVCLWTQFSVRFQALTATSMTSLLGCCSVQLCRYWQTFRRSVQPPSSGRYHPKKDDRPKV